MNKDKAWPLILTVVLVSMMIGLMIFIYYSVHHPSDLVTKAYYQEGLDYQNQINRLERSIDPAIRPEWKFLEDRNILITFPRDSAQGRISGEIIFFRPSDASLDTKIPLHISENNEQVISTGNLSKGYWRMKIFWARNGREYYFEDKIVL